MEVQLMEDQLMGDGGSTNGGSTNGGSTNGGSTNGGSTNGGSTNGGSTNGTKQPTPAPVSDAHPETINKIIHLTNKDTYKKNDLRTQKTAAYNALYNKLSEAEKKQVDKLIDHPAYESTVIPSSWQRNDKLEEIKTIEKAIEYLNTKM